MRITRWCLPLLFLLFSTLLSKADVVAFEGMSDGTAVTIQFSNLLFFSTTVATAGMSLNEVELPPHFGRSVGFDDGGPVSISFETPVTSVSGYFTYAVQIRSTAFDLSGNEIGAPQYLPSITARRFKVVLST
jgi:hypothetical protein